MIPIRTSIAIKGIDYSLDLSKNIKKMHTAVNPKVMTLKVENVSLIIYKGFVRGVSSDAKKKALIFSIANGKNYILMEKITLVRTIRAIPRTMLAWIRPGKHRKILPTECIIFQRGKFMTPPKATI